MLAFVPIFNAAREEILSTLCNLETGKSIGDSPIDAHLDLLHLETPKNLLGQEISPDLAELFGETLAKVAGVNVLDLPIALGSELN